MPQPWEAPSTKSAPPGGGATCGAACVKSPEMVSVFETVARDIKKPYAKYIDPKKLKPGYIGSRSNVPDAEEFKKKFIENRTRSAEKAKQGRLAKEAAKRDKALADAASASEPERSRLITRANSVYQVNANLIEADARVEISSARMNAYNMNGFVDDDGQLYLNPEGPEPARTARHEAIHMFASPKWDEGIGARGDGHALDEAVTEYFTQQVGFADTTGKSNLKPEYTEGSKMIRDRYSEDALSRAYYQGDFSKMNKEYKVDKTVSEFNKKFPGGG